MNTKDKIAKLEVELELLKHLDTVEDAELEKFVRVYFESSAELATALIAGRIFKTNTWKKDSHDFNAELSDTLVFDSTNGCCPFRLVTNDGRNHSMDHSWSLFADLFEEIQEEPVHWYTDIPEGGVLCHVSDMISGSSSDIILKVLRYSEALSYPFRTSGEGWKYATPVSEKIQEEPAPWVEDIPEGGVLCYVSDSRIEVDKIDRFTSTSYVYRHDARTGDEYPFKTANEGWKYAIPVAQEV